MVQENVVWIVLHRHELGNSLVVAKSSCESTGCESKLRRGGAAKGR